MSFAITPPQIVDAPSWSLRWDELLAPWRQVDWTAIRDFWMHDLLIDRMLVVYALPLLLVLIWFRNDRLRLAIVATGLAFLGFLFGAFYALFWLGYISLLYRLSEMFAREVDLRTAAHPDDPDEALRGPTRGAILVISLLHLATLLLPTIKISWEFSRWLVDTAPWLLPFGLRGLGWEPQGLGPITPNYDTPRLMPWIFQNAHIIGTAYLLVRMLHYFSEIRRGGIPRDRRTYLNFLSWVCYAPNLMQGPIERFPRFQEELDTAHQRRGWRNLPPALIRFAWAIAKTLIAYLYLQPYVIRYLQWPGTGVYYANPAAIDSTLFLYIGVYIHIFWLYLYFSAYCDISAAIAKVLGYRQIENFNWPWIATSMRDFWRRWHISLSMILRDYIYIALGGNRRHTVLNLIATFALCGVWHLWGPHFGEALQLGAWGALMGLMVAINQQWVNWVKRVDANPHHWFARVRRLARRIRPLPQLLAWALTMHFFVHSLLLFFGGNGVYRVTAELIRRLAVAVAGAW